MRGIDGIKLLLSVIIIFCICWFDVSKLIWVSGAVISIMLIFSAMFGILMVRG